MGEYLDAYHVINSLWGTFHFPVDWWLIATSGFDKNLVVKNKLHEIFQWVNLTTFINTKDVVRISIVLGELD